ncbi:MAG: ROK family transcriptional regulator [Spirochaetales bacterium]|nr:ROK family transcriptional regulator [Spirochaetales bacterium]
MLISGEALDHGAMQRNNASLILRHIQTRPGMTRTDLARRLGATRGTITNIVDKLIRRRLIHEVGVRRSSGGRPGVELELNPRGGACIGVEIKDSFVSVRLADFKGGVLWDERTYFADSAIESVLTPVEALTDEAVRRAGERRLPVLGIGMGLSGLVDVHSGLISFSPNLQWRRVPIRPRMARRFPYPLHLANDAASAALGERYFGAGRGVDNFIYIESSDLGIGGSIFADGRILQGRSGYAGEIGHMTVTGAESRCQCGRRGCWQTEVGPIVILNRARLLADRHPTSALYELCGGYSEALTLDMIAAACEAGDTTAVALMEEVGANMAIGVTNLINIFNPDKVIIGGVLRAIAPYFIDRLTASANREAMVGSHERVGVEVSPLDNACTRGAVAMVAQAVIDDPLGSRGKP